MTVAASRRRDRQVVRILGILGTLLEGGQLSIRQLANRHGIRRETIYRDMRALEEAGYPIVGDEQGRLSHPRLLAEARRYAPHLRLSDSEIAALLWASKLAKTSSPFRSALASAGVKLRAMGISAQADLAAGIDAAFGEVGFSAKDYEPHKETVLRLVEAIVRHKRCGLRYWSPASPATKRYEFEPYRLLSVSGALYRLGRVPTSIELLYRRHWNGRLTAGPSPSPGHPRSRHSSRFNTHSLPAASAANAGSFLQTFRSEVTRRSGSRPFPQHSRAGSLQIESKRS